MPNKEDLADLVSFLIEAKRVTYAAGGGGSRTAVAPLLAGSHQLEHRRGAWLYRDVYFGEARFAGQETVYRDGKPVWTMCYAGGFSNPALPGAEAGEIGAALQAALSRVAADRPFRGPREYRQGALTYRDESEGDAEWFHGEEEISRGSIVIYGLRYAGGLLA
jgi:hypothetical protein